MALIIKALFKMADVRKYISDYKKEVVKANIERLKSIAVRYADDARLNADFIDHTGNLRSSIGCIIAVNGKIVYRNFEQAQRGTDKATGVKRARQFAEQVLKDYESDGIVLIVVAGMEYAAAVESKGREVITGSSYKAKAELNKYFKAK